MTKAVFLLELPSLPLVIFCCVGSSVNLQPVGFRGQERSPDSESVCFMTQGRAAWASSAWWFSLWILQVYQLSVCMCGRMLSGSKNPNSAIIICSAACCQRRLCFAKAPSWRKVAPLKPTGFHSNDGYSLQLPFLNRTCFHWWSSFPVMETQCNTMCCLLKPCTKCSWICQILLGFPPQYFRHAGFLASACCWINSLVRLINVDLPKITLVI